MVGKWRIRKVDGLWEVSSPDGSLRGITTTFNSAATLADCTPQAWLHRKCQRAALDAYVAEHQRLTA